MSLSALFTNDWLTQDLDERLHHIRNLDADADLDTLLEIINSDDDNSVKVTAIERITNKEVLSKLQERYAGESLVTVLEQRLNRVCYDRIMNSADVESVGDDLNIITDQSLLMEIATSADHLGIRHLAVGQLSDLKLLCKITESNCGKELGVAIIDKISDAATLEHISKRASNKKVRHHAEEKIATIQQRINQPTDDELRESELGELLAKAVKLVDTWNWDYGIKIFDECVQRWSQLDPDGGHRFKADFDNARSDFEKRRGEFQIRQEEDLKKSRERQVMVDNCKTLCGEVDRLTESGDCLSMEKLAECEHRWNGLEKLDDEEFDDLEERFITACEEFCATKFAADEEREVRKVKLEQLEQLCKDAEKWVTSEDWVNGVVEIESLERRWHEQGHGLEDIVELTEQFRAAVQSFKDNHEADRATQKNLHDESLRRLHDLCKTVEDAANSDDATDVGNQVNNARSAWFDANSFQMVNAATRSKLDRRFRKACDRYYKRQNEAHEQKHWEEWANLMLKEELCVEVESLNANDSLHEVASAIKEIQGKWKDIGSVPKEKEQSIWSRFRRLCDLEFSRCKIFFKELDKERQANLHLKERICDQLDKIVEPVDIDWKKTVSVVRGMQDEWRAVGPIPQKLIIPMDQRYKALCDQYYRGHREHLKRTKEEEDSNGAEKERLCVEAELLAESAISKLAIDKVKRLQIDWKKIGKSPKKTEQVLWKRFAGACNKVFKNLESQKPDNLDKKEKIIKQIEQLLSIACPEMPKLNTAAVEDTRPPASNSSLIGGRMASAAGNSGQALSIDSLELNKENIESLTENVKLLQDEWKDIGPVPREREKEMWNRFHQPCNEFFEKRRDYYAKIKEQHFRCLAEKETLLFQLESLIDTDEWESAVRKSEQITEQWNNIGEVPIAKAEDLSIKFQEACDLFSDRRRCHFGELKEERVSNLKKKEALCLRLELLAGITAPKGNAPGEGTLSLSEELKLAFESNFAVASASDTKKSEVQWQKTLDEVQRIQSSWNDIGRVPRSYEQQLLSRFRRACDKCFEKKPERRRPTIGAGEMKKNLDAKLQICKTVELLAAKATPREVVNEIKKCQRTWKSIGPIASRKDADQLWHRYTSACDKVFDELRRENDILADQR